MKVGRGLLVLRALHEILTVRKTAIMFIANGKMVIVVCGFMPVKWKNRIQFYCTAWNSPRFLTHQNRVAPGKLLLVMVSPQSVFGSVPCLLLHLKELLEKVMLSFCQNVNGNYKNNSAGQIIKCIGIPLGIV